MSSGRRGDPPIFPVFPFVLLSLALFLWAAGARCMLVSVFGAATSSSNSVLETSAALLIQATERSRRTRHGKTKKNVCYLFYQSRCF